MFFKTNFGMFSFDNQFIIRFESKDISSRKRYQEERETKEGRSIDYYPKKEEKNVFGFLKV